jgi:SPP1 gp7 family putative phage head morphogenesis protein
MTNQDIIDTTIGHQVDLEFYANGVVQESVGQLNAADQAILAMIAAWLLSLTQKPTPAQVDSALAPVLDANQVTYLAIEQGLNAELLGAVDAEAEFQNELLEAAELDPVSVGTTGLFLAMLAVPMMGQTFSQTMDSLALTRATGISKAVQAGINANEPVSTILNAVKDAMEVSRRNMETVVRTVVTHAVEFVAAAMYALIPSPKIFSIMWLSVLDSRTTELCKVRNGKRYTPDTHAPIGHSHSWGAGPGMLHYNCRSSSAPLFFSGVPKQQSYDDWLRKQSVQTQNEILGLKRAQEYRDDTTIVADTFVNNKGKTLTLEQLRARTILLKST